MDILDDASTRRVMVELNDGDVKAIRYNDGPVIREKVMKRLFDYYNSHQSYCGECICQSDNPQMDAPFVLADIVDDILEVEVDWADE